MYCSGKTVGAPSTWEMKSVEFSTSACRICLQQGATYPIFDDSQTDIQDKLRKCMVEKLEDVEGYPRNICSNCKITLDMLCEFIDTYKRSCKLLRESFVIVKTEVDCNSSDHDYFGEVDTTFNAHGDFYEKLEIKIENVKSLVPVSLTGKENKIDTKQILKKLKPVPGLKITKVDSKKKKENVRKKSRTTEKAASGSISKSKAKIKRTSQNDKKKFVEVNEDIENRKKILEQKLVQMKEENSVLCSYCGAIYDKKDKLTRHIQSQHMDTKVTCPVCSKQFASTEMLKRHNSRVHGEKTIQCEYCEMKFSEKGLLNSHTKSVHKKHLLTKKSYTCQFCKKVYKSPQARTVHERTVHTGLKPDVCSVCGKAFAHISYLRQHMRLHTGEQPFKCPICERGYSQLCNMKSHIKHNHKRSELNDKIMPKMRPSFMKYLKNC